MPPSVFDSRGSSETNSQTRSKNSASRPGVFSALDEILQVRFRLREERTKPFGFGPEASHFLAKCGSLGGALAETVSCFREGGFVASERCGRLALEVLEIDRSFFARLELGSR